MRENASGSLTSPEGLDEGEHLVAQVPAAPPASSLLAHLFLECMADETHDVRNLRGGSFMTKFDGACAPFVLRRERVVPPARLGGGCVAPLASLERSNRTPCKERSMAEQLWRRRRFLSCSCIMTIVLMSVTVALADAGSGTSEKNESIYQTATAMRSTLTRSL